MTKRQHEVFKAIDYHIQEHGYCPSFKEIGEMVGLRSVATVHKHVRALVGKGYIRGAGFNAKRGLQVVEARRGEV